MSETTRDFGNPVYDPGEILDEAHRLEVPYNNPKVRVTGYGGDAGCAIAMVDSPREAIDIATNPPPEWTKDPYLTEFEVVPVLKVPEENP